MRDSCLMKRFSETASNLSYFWNLNFIFHFAPPGHSLRKKKKCTVRNEKKITMSIPISKLWQFLRCFLLDFSWRINLLFQRRSEFFLCCLYLLLLSITLTERDLYLLKADESHLDWLAKKKASLATKQEQKNNLEFLNQRIKYIYKNMQNKGSIHDFLQVLPIVLAICFVAMRFLFFGRIYFP